MISQLRGLKQVHAGRAFGLLAAIFVLILGVMVALVALDQQRVLEATARLQEETVPEIIRYQRLARNLEQLRQEGERVFAAATPQARQQAMFVVTLVASHPSVLEHKAAAELAQQVETFLGDAMRQMTAGARDSGPVYEEWQRLAERVGLMVDDVSIQGINLATNDLSYVAEAMRLARYKLTAALIVAGLFLAMFVALIRIHLIYPLQRIDRALSTLSVDRPAPEFEPSTMVEIQSVEAAIGELHASLMENEAARHALEKLANRDGLTGLINRRHFMQTADAELMRAQRYERPVTIGMADLDCFKNLNDTYGHAVGDTVLRAFAELVQEVLRQSDLVCRYGGEEFAFLFPESSLDEAQRLAERLRSRCAEYDIRIPDGRLVRVTLSMGLADASDCPIETALRRADEALYQAKRLGRNRVELAAPVEAV
ncbi:MAG: GGDEF domain-containing protein [Rhodocyclales bacterium GT-UBC]|nr:MAG: GGDEF domain-containing protein [Rhodocyclales bacterium GT-UBC]